MHLFYILSLWKIYVYWNHTLHMNTFNHKDHAGIWGQVLWILEQYSNAQKKKLQAKPWQSSIMVSSYLSKYHSHFLLLYIYIYIIIIVIYPWNWPLITWNNSCSVKYKPYNEMGSLPTPSLKANIRWIAGMSAESFSPFASGMFSVLFQPTKHTSISDYSTHFYSWC